MWPDYTKDYVNVSDITVWLNPGHIKRQEFRVKEGIYLFKKKDIRLNLYFIFCIRRPPRWPSGKASASRAEGPGFESRLRPDFFRVESYQ